jgi:hypothetical protein
LLENDAIASVGSVAPTVMAAGSEDGEKSQALDAAFPAATVTVKPAAAALATAVLKELTYEEPRERLMTPGSVPLTMIQSRPVMASLTVPEPLHPITRTGTRVACLATP